MSNLDELRREVETLAKRANQRLRQMEMSGIAASSKAYQVTAQKVYDQRAGYVTTRSGNIAFDRSLKNKTERQLEAELRELDKFLGANTSQVRGYKSSLKKAYSSYIKSEWTGADGKTKENAPSFSEWQNMFTAEATKVLGYKSVQGVLKATGKKYSEVAKEIEKAAAESLRTKRTLGRVNLINRVKKATEKKSRSRRKR